MGDAAFSAWMYCTLAIKCKARRLAFGQSLDCKHRENEFGPLSWKERNDRVRMTTLHRLRRRCTSSFSTSGDSRNECLSSTAGAMAHSIIAAR